MDILKGSSNVIPEWRDLEKFATVPRFERYFKGLQKTHDFSGTVLIADKGKIIHTGAYGYGNLKRKDTLTVDSEFQLASVSKMFTATAILLLYEEGKTGP